MTATTKFASSSSPGASKLNPAQLYLTAAWQGLVGLACLYSLTLIWGMDANFNLSGVIQAFLSVIALVFGTAAIGSAVGLLRMNNVARMVGMFVNLTGAILSALYLAHLLGLYIGIDALAEGVYRNVVWLIGIPVGYAIMWLGGRFDKDGEIGFYVTRAGIGVILISLALLLWFAGLPAAVGLIFGALFQPASLAAVVVIALFTLAAVFLFRSSEAFGETIEQREAWQGWLFLLPNFISFMIFFALPLLLSFYLSFTDYGRASLRAANWVGLENYGTVINDPMFWQSLWTTIRYCILLLLLSIPTALGLAMILNAKIPGMKFFRAVYFLPSIAAVVGVALIWQWLYHPVIGFINYALAGLYNLFGAASPDPQWLTDDALILVAVVIMAAWQVVGFNTVIFLAGLQGVNKEVLEAAWVDGANGWTRFRRILLPLIAPTTFFVTVTTLITGLQAFSEFYTLLRNSTSNARLTTVFYLYLKGFRDIDFGYASATAWALFLIIFVVTLAQFRLSSRAEAYSD